MGNFCFSHLQLGAVLWTDTLGESSYFLSFSSVLGLDLDLIFVDSTMLIRGVILYLWQRKAHLHRLNLSLQGVFLPDVIEVGRTWKGRRGKKKV